MNRSTLRILIIILTLITALIHLILLPYLVYQSDGSIAVSFLLNGMGYLVLLWALLRPPAFLASQGKLVHYVFMAYTVVTILAWYFLNGDFGDPLGLITKLDEVLLIVALWLHSRTTA